MNKKAFSLIEIIISILIIILVARGLVYLFLTSRQYTRHSYYRKSAAELGRLFLDPLQAYVRQDTWDASCFGTTKVIANCPNVPTTSGNYTAVYSIGEYAPLPNLRKVKLTINWSE